MKVSLNLLKQFAVFDRPVGDILKLIAERVGAIEQVVELGPAYADILVGQIKQARPHPDADKLGVYQVDIGTKTVQVVAGDKTLSVGDRVAYIPPGAIVPATRAQEELKIEVRSIRGQASRGMLASARELSFGDSHVGVLKLDTDGKAGSKISEAYYLDDYIIEVENKVLTHRPDAFGHIGFARDLCGVLGQAFISPPWFTNTKPNWPKPSTKLDLKIANLLPQVVPRYTAAAYSDVIIQASPVQTQSWLARLGIRPINNVVDLTNYLMLVTGQPMHAFDYDKVRGSSAAAQIDVRYPKKGERITLIDGREITPHSKAIVIASKNGPIGLGGVMGGADTEVDNHSKNVILEAATFDMYSIRNTAMAHGISSEAVTRFARGQDPAAAGPVQARARQLMDEWTGAVTASPLLDDYEKKRQPHQLKTTAKEVNALLGVKESAKYMARALKNVELDAGVHADKLDIKVPTWRPDLSISADIAEEIGRLGGYDRIKTKVPGRSLKPVDYSPQKLMERKISRILTSAGANEVLTYSGVPERLLASAGQDKAQAYRIRNAISPDVQFMRLSLTPGLLDKVHLNIKKGYERFVLFEIGSSHHRALIEAKLPEEQRSLALVYAASSKSGSTKSGSGYYHAQKYLRFLFSGYGSEFLLNTALERGDPWLEQVSAVYERTRRSFINVNGQVVGVIGEFTALGKRGAKLPLSSAGFELHLGRWLIAQPQPSRFYTALSKYPPISVDLTLRTPFDTPFAKLEEVLKGEKIKHVDLSIKPLDIFSPDDQHKHTSFRITLQHQQRTMTQTEADSILKQLMIKLQKKVGARQV